MNQEGIWILEEHDKQGLKIISLELLSEGQKLARQFKEQLCVCLIGYQVEDYISTLNKYGAEKIYLVENELLSEYNLDTYVFVLGKLIEEYNPSILIMGATSSGAELAPRIAARFKLPCITEAKKITGDKENLQITKSAYNDQAYVSINPIWKRPLILTITAGETDINESDEPKEVEVIRKNVEINSDIMRTKYRKFIKADPRTIGLEEADKIVAIGNGLEIEAFPIVQELADNLGASIGGTRVAVDNGVIPYERQIGVTGKSVAPKFLIACGISGAREFTTGMEKSILTVAINTDRKARIFDVVDMGVVGDVHQVVPALIQKLKQRNYLQ
ncbi:MAG: electron transfer flavoprotein subunit alpha/FixB family protein [Candidatus Hodarchaeota archaeon]